MTPDEKQNQLLDYADDAKSQGRLEAAALFAIAAGLIATNELLEKLTERPAQVYRRSRGVPSIIHAGDCLCGQCMEERGDE